MSQLLTCKFFNSWPKKLCADLSRTFFNIVASNFQDHRSNLLQTWLSLEIFELSPPKNLAEKFGNSFNNLRIFRPAYLWEPDIKIWSNGCEKNTLKLFYLEKLNHKYGKMPEIIPYKTFFGFDIFEQLTCRFWKNLHVNCWRMLETMMVLIENYWLKSFVSLKRIWELCLWWG